MVPQSAGGGQGEHVYAPAEADAIAMPPTAAQKKKKKKEPEEPKVVGGFWIAIAENKYFKYGIWFTVLISMLLMCVDSPYTGPAFSTAYDPKGKRYVLETNTYTSDGIRYGYREYEGSDERGSSAWVSTEQDWISSSGERLWRPDLLNSLELLCTAVYSFEALVLILSKGWRPYFHNFRNATQFIVMLAGWIKVFIYFGGL